MSVCYVYLVVVTGELHAPCVPVPVGRILWSYLRAARGWYAVALLAVGESGDDGGVGEGCTLGLTPPLLLVGGSTRLIDCMFDVKCTDLDEAA